MAGEIFFDNSALSRLVDEAEIDRRALIAGLRTLGTPRISELNVRETARTNDPAVRMRKLQIYKQLTGNVAPMNSPVELLAMAARAHGSGVPRMDVGSQFAYQLVANPESATEELREELTASAREEEESFKRLHDTMRSRFEGSFDADARELLPTETHFLSYVFENADEMLQEPVTGFYLQATGRQLAPLGPRAFLDAMPPWKIFIAAHLHALWVRAVKPKGPGKRSAGSLDTDSAVYLNYCDRFITNDRAQAETLTVANHFNPRSARIEMYYEVRSRLIVDPAV